MADRDRDIESGGTAPIAADRKPPRLADVAAHAGLTSMTVSRALRQPDKVSPATRERVMQAITELGYIPDLAASSLASRRSRIIAVVVPTIANSVFADTVQGLSDGVAAAGYQLLLGQTGYSETAEHALVAALIGRRPDAVAHIGIIRDPELRELLWRAAVPVVETWDLTADPLDLLVGFSNEAAGRAIGEYLIGRGYRRIAFVGGRDDRAAARRSGLRAALDAAGLDASREAITDEPLSYGAGRRALAALLDGGGPPDAVFFATDVLAVGGLMECRRRKLSVPGRIAIAGLGDLEIAAELTPALTTVRVPSYEIGRRAADMLLARIEGEPIASPIVDLGFEIVQRESA